MKRLRGNGSPVARFLLKMRCGSPFRSEPVLATA